MKFNKIRTVVFSALILTTSAIRAQQVSQGDLNSWFLLLNRVKLNDRFSITNELHERTGSFLSDQGQFLERPSLDFHLNEQVEFSVGYTFINVQPYAPYNQPVAINENNLWEQALLKWEIGKAQLQNRFRQENRWVDRVISDGENSSVNGTTYSNRFRYRFTLTFDLIRMKEGKQALFFNGFDEVWINQDDRLAPTDFARNWLYLGLGYRFDQTTNVQLGYMNQYDKVGPDTYVNSPVLQLTLVKNFAL